MLTIDPNHESLRCPHCSAMDVRYNDNASVWKCRSCEGEFIQEDVSLEEIRLHKIKSPVRQHGAENAGQ
jgi:ribosomal protein L37AE/L43A